MTEVNYIWPPMAGSAGVTMRMVVTHNTGTSDARYTMSPAEAETYADKLKHAAKRARLAAQITGMLAQAVRMLPGDENSLIAFDVFGNDGDVIGRVTHTHEGGFLAGAPKDGLDTGWDVLGSTVSLKEAVNLVRKYFNQEPVSA